MKMSKWLHSTVCKNATDLMLNETVHCSIHKVWEQANESVI